MRRALLLLLTLAACADPEGPAAPEASAPAAAPPGPGVPLDSVLAARPDDGPFLQGLPAPARLDRQPVATRPGTPDTLLTYGYPGLQIEAVADSGGLTRIRSVAVQSVAVRTGGDVGIGSTRDEVEAAFGAPAARDGDVVTYAAEGGPPSARVEVRYEADRAVSLVWRRASD